MNNTGLVLGGRRFAFNSFQRYSSMKFSGDKDQPIPSSKSFHSNKIYKEIPKTRAFPIVGSLFHIHKAGSQPRFHEYIHKQHLKLGPIFLAPMGKKDVIFISDPELQTKVYRNEGKHPRHSMPDSWILFNERNQNPRGLFFM